MCKGLHLLITFFLYVTTNKQRAKAQDDEQGDIHSLQVYFLCVC